MDLNALLRPPLPHQGYVSEDLEVGFGEGRLDDAPWPEAALPDHIGLGGVEGDFGGQEDEGDQPQN